MKTANGGASMTPGEGKLQSTQGLIRSMRTLRGLKRLRINACDRGKGTKKRRIKDLRGLVRELRRSNTKEVRQAREDAVEEEADTVQNVLWRCVGAPVDVRRTAASTGAAAPRARCSKSGRVGNGCSRPLDVCHYLIHLGCR